ncbi:MAG: hydroxyacylglutathione hydrolase [Gammaproteobacteria bacterium]|nr:hydroxyacylglutathione hydrolase [Gammaproteobacteria bacterium]MCY4340064.1 hydroxyacylglutathione hydrolase [Gammaproteobacteria bacterium]
MALLQIHQFPCLSDNYGFLIHERLSGLTAAIDTPDPKAIQRELERKGWRLTHILNTHHHPDHAGGNLWLKEHAGCIIVGPSADAQRIPGIDLQIGEGETLEFGNAKAQVFDTPGHTRGHIVYYFPDEDVAFVGDTLFAMGCGRLFEGSPKQMWASLQKLMNWPGRTRIYCAHEYTQANGRFALTVDPRNQALIKRMEEVARLRAEGRPTVPTTLYQEKRTNPFLRPGSRGIRAQLGMEDAADVEVFAEVRRRKDRF